MELVALENTESALLLLALLFRFLSFLSTMTHLLTSIAKSVFRIDSVDGLVGVDVSVVDSLKLA